MISNHKNKPEKNLFHNDVHKITLILLVGHFTWNIRDENGKIDKKRKYICIHK